MRKQLIGKYLSSLSKIGSIFAWISWLIYGLFISLSFVETDSKSLDNTVYAHYGLELTFFWRAQNVSLHVVCGNKEQNEVKNLEDTQFGQCFLGRNNSK